VAPDPLWELGRGAARVEGDFGPVCVLEEFGVGEAEFLGAGVTDETLFVSFVGGEEELDVWVDNGGGGKWRAIK